MGTVDEHYSFDGPLTAFGPFKSEQEAKAFAIPAAEARCLEYETLKLESV